MKISNMKSPSGKDVPNQFMIFTPEATYFQSYDKIIVKITFEDGERVTYLDELYWNYSNTTSRYRNLFLGETSKEIKAKLNLGKYKFVDLNSEE